MGWAERISFIWARISGTAEISRPFFHWKFAGVTVPALWASGLAMVGFGISTPNEELVGPLFALAYIFIVAAAIYSVGCWFFSGKRGELLSAIKRKRAKLPKKKAQTRYRVWESFVLVSTAALTVLALYLTARLHLATMLSEFDGTLVAANDPDVPACGGVNKPTEGILLIGSAAVKADKWPLTVLSVAGKPRIVLDRNQDGDFQISVRVFNNEGHILAEVLQNAFNVNRSTIFKMERPDRSTLIVTDQSDNRVLYVRRINSHQIRLDADLVYPDYPLPINLADHVAHLCINVKNSKKEATVFEFN